MSETRLLAGLGRDDDVGDVAHIDRAAVARGQQQSCRCPGAPQRLAGDDVRSLPASRTRPAGTSGWRPDLGDELLQRHAVERSFSGSGSTRICSGCSPTI